MVNAWITHIRQFAKTHNLAYGCALSNPECIASYTKPQKPLTYKGKILAELGRQREAQDARQEVYLEEHKRGGKQAAKEAAANARKKLMLSEEQAEMTAMGNEDINRVGKRNIGVVALFVTSNYDNYVILNNATVMQLKKKAIVLHKATSIKSAYDWLFKNINTRDNSFFKTNYTYNQLTGSNSDFKLLDKYGLTIIDPSTATKLLFYDSFSTQKGMTIGLRLAQQPYKQKD